jgi:hypothetical protein
MMMIRKQLLPPAILLTFLNSVDRVSYYMFRTIWSQSRDVVLEGRTIDLGKPLGAGKWNGEGMGRGRSVYKQPGTRVDEDRTTQKGGIPSK